MLQRLQFFFKASLSFIEKYVFLLIQFEPFLNLCIAPYILYTLQGNFDDVVKVFSVIKCTNILSMGTVIVIIVSISFDEGGCGCRRSAWQEQALLRSSN